MNPRQPFKCDESVALCGMPGALLANDVDHETPPTAEGKRGPGCQKWKLHRQDGRFWRRKGGSRCENWTFPQGVGFWRRRKREAGSGPARLVPSSPDCDQSARKTVRGARDTRSARHCITWRKRSGARSQARTLPEAHGGGAAVWEKSRTIGAGVPLP